MADNQGQRANKEGRKLENKVEDLLIDKGVVSLKYTQVGAKTGKLISSNTPGFLLKNVPYTNMYGGKSRGEFVLQINNRGPIRIECRSQHVGGSVDEKIPYLIGNCLSFDEKEVILVIDGDGIRSVARMFLKNATKAIAHKHISVMTLPQFSNWVDRVLPKKDNSLVVGD